MVVYFLALLFLFWKLVFTPFSTTLIHSGRANLPILNDPSDLELTPTLHSEGKPAKLTLLFCSFQPNYPNVPGQKWPIHFGWL